MQADGAVIAHIARAVRLGAQRRGFDFTRVQPARHLQHQPVDMPLDLAQLFQTGEFCARARLAIFCKGKRHKEAGGVAVHPAHDGGIVQHDAVHMVDGRLRGLFAVHCLRRGVARKVQHTRRHGVFIRLRRVAAQGKQVQQHLRVQPAIYLVQAECLRARFVIDHAQVGAAVPLHHIHAVDLALHAHRAAVRRAQCERRHRIFAVTDLLLERGGMKLALRLLGLQKGQQPCDALLDALDEIAEAPPRRGHELRHVIIRRRMGQTLQLFGGKLRKRRARRAQHMFQNIVDEAAALHRRELGAAARADAQHILQKIRKTAAVILLHARGRKREPLAEQLCQRLRLLRAERRCTGRARHRGKAFGGRALLPQRRLQRGDGGRILAVGSAQQVQRGGRRGRVLLRLQCIGLRRQNLHQRLHRRAQRRAARLGRDIADIERMGRRGKRAVEKHLLQQRAVFVAARHLQPVFYQQLAVGVREQAARAQKAREVPLAHAQHKADRRAVEPHAVGGGDKHRVLRFGHAAQARGAQQQREQLGVFLRRNGVLTQKLRHLVEQLHHVLPRRVHRAGAQYIPRRLERRGGGLRVFIAAERLQQIIQLRGNARCRFAARGLEKVLHRRHHTGAQLLHARKLGVRLLRCRRTEAVRIPGERRAPIRRAKLPGIGIIFQRRNLPGCKTAQIGFQQRKQRLGGDAAA